MLHRCPNYKMRRVWVKVAVLRRCDEADAMKQRNR